MGPSAPHMMARRLAVVLFLLAVIAVTVLRLHGPEASGAETAILCWAATAVLVCAAARVIHDLRAALFAGWAALLAPVAAVPARLSSTEAPLITLWSTALLAVLKLREGGGWTWAVLLGAALGAGSLIDPSMLYAVGCALIALVFDRQTRRGLLSWKGLLALVIAAAIIAPTGIEPLRQELSALTRLVMNPGDLIPAPTTGIALLAAQALRVGPVIFVGWMLAAGATMAWRGKAQDGVMTAFSLPILLGVTTFGVTSGQETANAGAAAPALAATLILGAAWLERSVGGRRWMSAGLILCAVFQAVLLTGP